MKSYFEELKDFVLDSGSSRGLICRMYGYTENDRISKMKKSELARKLSDLQLMLRVAYENEFFDDRG